MSTRYAVRLDGPLTTITSEPQGPWPRQQMARLATIEHLERQVRECLLTVGALRRAGNFHEYRLLREELGADEVAQVRAGETLS